jgi:hypothetical protein
MDKVRDDVLPMRAIKQRPWGRRNIGRLKDDDFISTETQKSLWRPNL